MLSCFGLKLHMMVTMKALLSFYNIDLSIIHEAQNAMVLYLFENPAYFPFFYSIVCRRPRSRQVGARYGRPVAQKKAIRLF